ncbi:neurotransmitter-gated ion-channel ligand binding domain-containing protein [Ditylenchus destructor]|uniref:Neurotransmitter-gated ion-channel ligand binding domain-containing protein n=1 Tax=Ditylenchus destructor TaxID=166010 RepID=A0AAD4N9X9_9BILA|nr:neurotransmitter-gated ion-channel ligand binding domain-containing protein [Ditylenchus destructor]
MGSSSSNETFGPETAPAAEGSVLGNAAIDAHKLASFLTNFKMSSSPIQKSRGGERHMRILYDDLFADYQREIRPVLNDSEPLTVAVQFWLKQILKVDERDQTLNVYLWLELYWVDELLKWNPEHYGGLDRIHVPASKIWRPDLLVYNNANMNVEDNEMETNAIIKSNGEVTLFRAMITDIACSLSLSLFPFDQVGKKFGDSS